MDLTHLIAIAAALGWASGLRLYAVVFAVGGLGWMGWLDLPAGLVILQHPLVLGASLLLGVLEFFADKIPGLDTLWDSVHTLVRIPAGAALAGAVIGGDPAQWGPVWTTVAALAGAGLAATAHAAKATTRAAANTSPEPFSNIALSLAGDATVPLMLWLAWSHPMWFFPLLAVAVVLALTLVFVLLKFLRSLATRMAGNAMVANAEAHLGQIPPMGGAETPAEAPAGWAGSGR
jgi:hypothetical protein